jgi:hypothetical protein
LRAQNRAPFEAKRLLAAASLVAAASGCGSECVEVKADCSPLYEPTFTQIYTRTLAPTCAAGGSSCHGPGGGRGSLTFESQASAYAMLVGQAATDGGVRVLAGDPGCSVLVARLEADDEAIQMPPGSPLSSAERCSIERWIANGAKP